MRGISWINSGVGCITLAGGCAGVRGDDILPWSRYSGLIITWAPAPGPSLGVPVGSTSVTASVTAFQAAALLVLLAATLQLLGPAPNVRFVLWWPVGPASNGLPSQTSAVCRLLYYLGFRKPAGIFQLLRRLWPLTLAFGWPS